MLQKPKLRVKPLPIDAHPDIIVNESIALNPARHAAREIWSTWAKLQEAEPVVTDRRKFASAAKGVLDRISKTAIDAIARLEASQKDIERKIQEGVCPRTPDAAAGEIRNHWKGQRHPWVKLAEAIRQGDKRTAAAVLSAPGYLSGLDEAQHASLMTVARETFFKDDCALLADLDRAARRLVVTIAETDGILKPIIKEAEDPEAKALASLTREG